MENKMYVIRKNNSHPMEFIDCKNYKEVCEVINKQEKISKDKLKNLSNDLRKMEYRQWMHIPKYGISILCVSEDFFTTLKK